MKGPIRWYAVLGAVCVIAALAAACGDGDSEAPVPTPSGTPPGLLPTRAPLVLPTVDPDTPLVTYESPDKGYSIAYPEGWEIKPGFVPEDWETSQGSGSVRDVFIRTVEGRVLAQFVVTRVQEENVTVDGLIAKDAANLAIAGGRLDPSLAVPMSVGGVEGKQLRYSVLLAELKVEHVVAYAVVDGIGWRIGLNSYGSDTLNPYVPLFERIVESFQPQ